MPNAAFGAVTFLDVDGAASDASLASAFASTIASLFDADVDAVSVRWEELEPRYLSRSPPTLVEYSIDCASHRQAQWVEARAAFVGAGAYEAAFRDSAAALNATALTLARVEAVVGPFSAAKTASPSPAPSRGRATDEASRSAATDGANAAGVIAFFIVFLLVFILIYVIFHRSIEASGICDRLKHEMKRKDSDDRSSMWRDSELGWHRKRDDAATTPRRNNGAKAPIAAYDDDDDDCDPPQRVILPFTELENCADDLESMKALRCPGSPQPAFLDEPFGLEPFPEEDPNEIIVCSNTISCGISTA